MLSKNYGPNLLEFFMKISREIKYMLIYVNKLQGYHQASTIVVGININALFLSPIERGIDLND